MGNYFFGEDLISLTIANKKKLASEIWERKIRISDSKIRSELEQQGTILFYEIRCLENQLKANGDAKTEIANLEKYLKEINLDYLSTLSNNNCVNCDWDNDLMRILDHPKILHLKTLVDKQKQPILERLAVLQN